MIIVTTTFTDEEYTELFTLKVGDIFKFSEMQYETLQQRIKEKLPEGDVFTIGYGAPGTYTHMQHGPNSVIVVASSAI